MEPPTLEERIARLESIGNGSVFESTNMRNRIERIETSLRVRGMLPRQNCPTCSAEEEIVHPSDFYASTFAGIMACAGVLSLFLVVKLHREELDELYRLVSEMKKAA